uniref:Uncharacterized protein n=1 Tax=Oryza sativa subsp. japonica TaxID=39947 RepID=Q6ERL1_ORYSJ|nr:hypothetical protein [Oryza sativa Japonica Group]
MEGGGAVTTDAREGVACTSKEGGRGGGAGTQRKEGRRRRRTKVGMSMAVAMWREGRRGEMASTRRGRWSGGGCCYAEGEMEGWHGMWWEEGAVVAMVHGGAQKRKA